MTRKLNFNACEFVKREQNQIQLHKKPFLENTIKPNKPMGAFGRQFAVAVSATKFFCKDALGSFVLIDCHYIEQTTPRQLSIEFLHLTFNSSVISRKPSLLLAAAFRLLN